MDEKIFLDLQFSTYSQSKISRNKEVIFVTTYKNSNVSRIYVCVWNGFYIRKPLSSPNLNLPNSQIGTDPTNLLSLYSLSSLLQTSPTSDVITSEFSGDVIKKSLYRNLDPHGFQVIKYLIRFFMVIPKVKISSELGINSFLYKLRTNQF